MQRYFIDNQSIQKDLIYITGDDYHHIRNVMRMKVGQEALFCNQDEEVYLAELIEYHSNEVVFKIKEEIQAKPEMPVHVTIAQGLIRRDKQEEVIRRITELGASTYIPVEMERSVIKVREKNDNKRDRSLRIIKEASEQSHRTKLMELKDITGFKDLVELSKNYDLNLYAYEESGREKNYNFKKYLEEFSGSSILVIVGPEGGFSQTEVKILEENNFKAIGLGPRILRTETAPLYIMSAISYQLELGEEK